jgi:hypothetical protein
LKTGDIVKERCMRRVTDCKASEDYRLWLRFDDGLEGSVFLGNLLEIGAFRRWRDVSQFCGAVLDPAAATVVWEGGIRFDPDVLYQDLLMTGAGKEFSGSELAPAVE